jgi:hypothetical protein
MDTVSVHPEYFFFSSSTVAKYENSFHAVAVRLMKLRPQLLIQLAVHVRDYCVLPAKVMKWLSL